jgi:micrococcal nuclease
MAATAAAGCGGDDTSRTSGDGVRVDVVEVVDGDTFVVTSSGTEYEVRLIGVDAPEDGECWSREAAMLLEGLLGAEVVLRTDESDRDRFGRLLRYVEVDGGDVNLQLVRAGAATAREYPPDTARAESYRAAQDAAQTEERGLWAADACGRSVVAELAIDEVAANAPGDDRENPNGEYVTISNLGQSDLDLTSWILRDESASHRYVFAEGFVLASGASVTVRTGCGEDGEDILHWCSGGGAVWNNDGDTVILQDPNGNIVLTEEYSG